MTPFKWLLVALFVAATSPAFAQLAPTGEHYAARASDTGYSDGLGNNTGIYSATVPLVLPAARGGLSVPLQIAYRAQGVGAAGLGWDVTLSYIQSDRTFAHRRPLSAPATLPAPRERTYLSLPGQTVELDYQTDSGHWLAHYGSLALTARRNGDVWEVDDGAGRLYTFARPTAFGATGLWLLQSVSATGGGSVELTYQTTTEALDGGTGIEVDLVRLRYNPHPLTPHCWKNAIVLDYGYTAAHPLSLSVLGDKIVVRRRLLTRVDVQSRATCTTSSERLRRYELEYPDDGRDPDTGLPRLRTVRMSGRQGTAEESASLPVVSYDYGAATQGGALRYRLTQSIAQPAGIAHDEISGTIFDSSVNVPATGHAYALWQSLIDVNGDGRPDLVFQKNDKLWVAYNQPVPGGNSTFGNGPAIAQLSDATLPTGPLATHTSTQPRFHYAPAKSNVVYVWRQALDVNGDGRIDVVDAAEQPDRWVVYLNRPGPQGAVKWERRSFSVTALRKTLTDFGHIVPNEYVPLSKRITGANLGIWECWRWSGTKWEWWSDGFANGRCDGVDGGIDGSQVERGQERTFVEWDFRDINGDGYPDVVFNSSPVAFQLVAPCPSHPAPPQGAACPHDFGIGGKILVPFAPARGFDDPARGNKIRAMLNVVGVRFYTDENPFAQSFDLLAPHADQGVEQWACSQSDPDRDIDCPDQTLQSQVAGLVDVNGDGLSDRVWTTQAFLGSYAGTAMSFSTLHLNLPGALATQSNTHATACAPGSTQDAIARQIGGMRDLTGDGVPDYIDVNEQRAWIGTGAGFHEVGIAVTGGDFVLSEEAELCDGHASTTYRGLFDIDGDGRPDVVERYGSAWRVYQLGTGGQAGAPDAGRLVSVDNGYGALTHIAYESAKAYTDNPLPFPEIVVSSIGVEGTQHLGGSLAGARYAYSNAELVFDSNQDRFSFPGYRRTVELVLQPAPRSSAADDRPIGAATVTDAWPQTEFQAGASPEERWLRTTRTGEVRDVIAVRGTATVDPWSLLNIDVADPRVVGVTHADWGATLFQSPPSNAGLANCIEMVDPYDFQVSTANAGLDICRARGFAFPTLTESWYGASPPPSADNVQTRTRVQAVDDFGRVTSVRHEGDVFRFDDDFCLETEFASPLTVFPRVLTAVAKRRMVDCDKRTTYASESFEYDNESFGTVSRGSMTSHTVDRRDTSNGALIKSIRAFDADYDAAGNMSRLVTVRDDGAVRAVMFTYDPFGLVPTSSTVAASGIPAMSRTLDIDPVSLALLDATDPYQVHRSNAYDGFGRWVRSAIALPGGTYGVVSTADYEGFEGGDPQGRRVVLTRYMDPVPPAMVANAAAHRATSYLDELGRVRFTDVALGQDYGNETLVVGARSYDFAGRVRFAAGPYPKSESGVSRYGTTYFYKATGDLDCLIRGPGPQAFTMVSNVLDEVFPHCFDRVFADHTMAVDVRDAASLQSNSPQENVVRRTVFSAIGNALEQSTIKSGVRLDDASFVHDRLGQITSMVRFLSPLVPADPVQWSWGVDSLGHTLRLSEPESATRTFEYSDWGDPIAAYWMDGSVEKRIVRRFDALGRVVAAEERSDGLADPATVALFAYDTPVSLPPYVSPTFVQGRLSEAVSATGRIAFSYDALGRVNANAFRDFNGNLYIDRFEHHANGFLATLGFNLPDDNYAAEVVKYDYDTAGRLREISAAGGAGAQSLFKAAAVDPFGRVRKASYGASTVFTADYSPGGRRMLRRIDFESPAGSRRIEFARFDALGRETAREEFVDNVAVGPPTFVTYDGLGRLVAAQSQTPLGPSWQFSYDALGNIVKLRDLIGGRSASLGYRLVDRDRICRIEYAESLTGSDCNVDHDATAGVVRQPVPNGWRQLDYFLSGSVHTITQGDATAQFGYDAFGVLAALDVQSGSASDERHDRHFGTLIERRDPASGNAAASQLYRRIPGPGGIVATRRGPGNDWIFRFDDSRGARLFMNDSGAFVQEIGYQPFGEAKSTGAQPGAADYSREQWNGGDALTPFGLVNLGARVYDPAIGRFLSRDPLLIARGSATSNPYEFAMNDPVNAADPSGLCVNLVCGIQGGTGSGDGGGGSAPVVPAPDVGPTLQRLGSVFFGSARAPAPAPPVWTGPYAVNIDASVRWYQWLHGQDPWRVVDFTHDWAHEPAPDAPYMRLGVLGIPVAWAMTDSPAKRVFDIALLATGIWGAAQGLTNLVISQGIALSGAEIAGGSLALREAYLPALEDSLSSLFIEEGIPASVRYNLAEMVGEGQSFLYDLQGVGEQQSIVDALLADVPGFGEEFANDIEGLAMRPLSGFPVVNEAVGQRIILTQWGHVIYNYVPTGHQVVLRAIFYTRPLVPP